MKTIQTTLIITSLCLSGSGFAAQPTDKGAVKQTARDTCLTKATEVYGSATTKSKAKKMKIGKVRGYSFTLKVGQKNAKIKCLADANGETVFYEGRR